MSSGLRDARVLQAFTQGVQRIYMLGVEQRLTSLDSASSSDATALNYTYVEKTSGFSTTSSTAVDVTGLSVTITTTGRPVLVAAVSQAFYVSHTGQATGSFGLSFDGTDTWCWDHETQGNSYRTITGLGVVHLFTASAGTHTIKARAKTNAGTLELDGGSTYPAQLIAVEL